MSKQVIFEFLEALTANNSKEWMDANRQWYHEAKDEVVHIFEPILHSLKELDPRIVQPNARKCISRINNNLMFHPERPTYKDHFGVVFGYGKGWADFYIHLGVDETEIAGGLWHPGSEKLKKVRTEIDYEGDKLRSILEAKPFSEWFSLYQQDKLKTAPKGYSQDHEFIELLRLKSIAALRPITRQDVFSDHFHGMVVESYKAIVPLLDFINVAIHDD
jgi:uncharacterized protein (TIGR02453 family)